MCNLIKGFLMLVGRLYSLEHRFSNPGITSPRPSGSPVPYGGKQAARTGLTSRLRRESRHSCGLPNPSPTRGGEFFSPFPSREGGWGVRFLDSSKRPAGIFLGNFTHSQRPFNPKGWIVIAQTTLVLWRIEFTHLIHNLSRIS